MLARLQRWMVAASVLAALAWLGWSLHAGLPGWAIAAGALLALLPTAPVLALEFVLLAIAGRDAHAPRAGAFDLLRAWAGEVVASWRVFGRDQPFFADADPDVPATPGPAGRTGVLLVHGYFCNRGAWRPWLRRSRGLGLPCTALTLEPAFGEIDTWVPAIDAAVARLHQATGRPPLIVAHSMGGLAIRAWLAATPGAVRRVQHVITVGTPHQGTWMARFGHTRNARQMRIGGPWLAALGSAATAAPAAHFTCFYGHADNIVFPASTATLPGADNRHLRAVAHVAMLEHPDVWAEVLRRLAD